MFSESPVQVAAIEALVGRSDPRVGIELPRLLAAHQDLDVRLSAASALLEIGCDRQCIAMVLDYLEDVYLGVQDIEQIARTGMELDATRYNVKLGKDPAVPKRERLLVVLHELVSANEESALDVLVWRYGVQSQIPSLFAIDLLGRVRIPHACEIIGASLPGAMWRETEHLEMIEQALVNQGCD